MSWLHVRPRTLAGAAIVSVAAIGITTMAVAYEGNPTTELELNDGAVWITKADQQLVGHFNAESEVLDGRFAAPTADYDVLQDGDRALVHDLGDDTLGAIDTAAVALGESVQLPADAFVDYASSTIAVLDVAKGALHVVPHGGLGQFSVAAAKPVLDKLGENAVVTVGRDGTVYAVSPEKSTLYTLPVTAEGGVDKETIREQELEGVGESSVLSISSVGDVPVLLDEDAGAVIVPGGPTLPLDEPEDARLALDAAEGDAVVVATRTQLLRLPLDGSDPTATPAGATSGTPAEPVWLNGCAYGAWMESGRFLRDCVGEADDLSSAIRDYKAGGELRFRVNRDVVMLNDVMSGAAWLASDVLQKVDNWDDLTPPKGDGVENPDPTTVQVPDPSPPDRGEDNTPPIANPDRFGVRAGASTILPVLDNDSDPDGDVLVISLPDGSPPGVEVQLINDGTSLQIAVPAGVTSVDSFRYEISDGRPGGTAETTVGIDVHPDAENAAPKQLREIAVPVETGSSVTYNVLPDWIDPDGDNIYLESVTPAEGDEAEFTADGRITYRAISGNQGPTDVNITVSDGDASMTGVFKLDVRATGSTPPLATADHLVVRAGQQGTVAPLANDLSASDEPLELTQVSEVQGASIVTDYASDTFTFESGTVGTYYVDYLVTTSGTAPVPGIVRVDVIEPVESDDPPVAVRDVALLPVGGDALVNVLANDSDPAGGVLVVQSVEAAEDSGVSVSVLGHETLRVTDRGMTTEGGEVTIRYTISNGAASAEGEVVVIALPSPSKLRAPVVNPDSAVVRVGDVVTIPVLENDYHPNDDEFHLDPELVEVPDPAAGEAFVSQDDVRFRAGDQPGTVYVTYAAVDSTGQRAATQVAIQVMPLDDENNNTPRPEDIEARALAGTQTTIAIPLDRIDGDGDSVELIGLASGPKKGTIVETGADRLVYEAFRDASGLDTFAYRVRDPFGAEATATIRVGIAPAAAQNQQPYAVRDSLAMRPGRVVAAPVLENDSDPDGDRFGLIQGVEGLILGEDPAVEAEAVGNRVIVTAPDRELETSLQYTIEDARGARAQGVLQITVDEDVPLQSPIARDDRVLIGDIDPETQTAEIPLLENDEDPDGTAEALEIALETDDGAELIGDGSARVSVQETRRLIGYTVTDEDGQSSKAFIHVPGQEDLRPTLLDTEPAQVQSGKPITLPLADYVKAASGNSVRLTEAEKVTSGHGDGSSLVVDAQTLTYTSAYRYSGSDAVTFEVTDGSGPDDPNGRVSTLSIPITVTAPVNEPPEMVGASVRVGAGDTEPGVVELSGLATDIDNDPLTFELVEVPDGIEAAIDGSTLSVTAEADQKGTVGTITVGVDDGEENPESPEPVTAPIEVTVTASTRELPVATDDTFAEWNQGETLNVSVLDNDVNPFAGEAPLTVTNAQLEVGSSQDASVEFDDDSVSITPAEDFHGRLVVRYQIEDQTGDPDRTAEARVNVTVQGRPDAPPKASVSNVQSRQLTLTWRPPADNGASITEYRVTAVKGGEYETVCPETTCTLTGLTNNVTYAFAVTAVNKVGESDASPASQEGRPDVRPHVPAAPQLPQFRDGGLQVTWKAPGNEGSPITKYELEITPAPPNGVNTKTVPAGTTQLWWDGLANGTAYTVRVRAHNSAPDPSDWSPQSGTNIPAKPPAAPGAASVKRQSSIGSTAGGVEVKWPAVEGAAAGGDAVDTYQVQAYRGGSAYGDVHSTSGTRYVVTLPASTADYTFQVRAKNKAGWGAWSKASTPLRQFTSPTAPGTPNVKAGDGWVEASWSAATAEGASSGEIQYSYSVNGGAWTPVGTATSATIGGLDNGTSYRVAVRAHAVAGGVQSESGPASAQSSAAVPFGPPAAPAAQAVQSGDGGRAITYSWSSPGNSNGRDITALEISVDGGAWQGRPLSDSEQVQYDYEQTHTIAVRVQNSEGQWSAETSASGRTADRPKPAATVSASERNRGVGEGCNGRCHYLQLNYENFPAGDYSIVCRDYNDGGSGFATVKRTLSGAGSSELGCFYGFEGKEVWLDVTGPNGFSLSTPRWIYQHPS